MQIQLGRISSTSGSQPALESLRESGDRVDFHPVFGDVIAHKAGTHFNPQCDVVAYRIKDGHLLGGVMYTDYSRESISMHSAAWTPHWINRDMLFVAFDYPFRQLGVKRIFGQTPEDNKHALEFNRKCGFKVIARIEGVYPNNVACVVTKLEAEECRFLHIKPRGVKSNRT